MSFTSGSVRVAKVRNLLIENWKKIKRPGQPAYVQINNKDSKVPLTRHHLVPEILEQLHEQLGSGYDFEDRAIALECLDEFTKDSHIISAAGDKLSTTSASSDDSLIKYCANKVIKHLFTLYYWRPDNIVIGPRDRFFEYEDGYDFECFCLLPKALVAQHYIFKQTIYSSVEDPSSVSRHDLLNIIGVLLRKVPVETDVERDWEQWKNSLNEQGRQLLLKFIHKVIDFHRRKPYDIKSDFKKASKEMKKLREKHDAEKEKRLKKKKESWFQYLFDNRMTISLDCIIKMLELIEHLHVENVDSMKEFIHKVELFEHPWYSPKVNFEEVRNIFGTYFKPMTIDEDHPYEYENVWELLEFAFFNEFILPIEPIIYDLYDKTLHDETIFLRDLTRRFNNYGSTLTTVLEFDFESSVLKNIGEILRQHFEPKPGVIEKKYRINSAHLIPRTLMLLNLLPSSIPTIIPSIKDKELMQQYGFPKFTDSINDYIMFKFYDLYLGNSELENESLDRYLKYFLHRGWVPPPPDYDKLFYTLSIKQYKHCLSIGSKGDEETQQNPQMKNNQDSQIPQ